MVINPIDKPDNIILKMCPPPAASHTRRHALAAPFLLSDEVGKSKGFLNEFSMVLHNVVSELEDLFVVIEDGILVGLTPMGELIKEMAIETLLMFSEIIHDVVIILKRFANEGQGIAGLLHLIATPLTMLVRLFGFLGTDVLQTILTFKILNGILPITNMMQAMNIKTIPPHPKTQSIFEVVKYAL